MEKLSPTHISLSRRNEWKIKIYVHGRTSSTVNTVSMTVEKAIAATSLMDIN